MSDSGQAAKTRQEGQERPAIRIQRQRTMGWRMPEGAVYVGRPTLPSPAAVNAKIEELRGRDLACWCPLDAPCHADVLLELANPAEPQSVSCLIRQKETKP